VAPIPASDAGEPPAAPVAQLAVDDEPEDAQASATRTLTVAPPDGAVLPAAEVAPSFEPEEPVDPADEEMYPTDVAAIPPVVPPPATVRSAPADGIQRYGEAVVRQVLDARFVREEPYQQPTRFS
jgi:DNA polymerase-3 subunit gamma/tau